MWFAYLATILAVVSFAEGYGDGAPSSACKDMIPRHPADPKPHPAPYVITPSTKVVKAGTPMTVTISGVTEKDTIRGIMLQARAGNEIVGLFTVDANDPLARIMKCNVLGDTVTHKRHDPKDDKQSVTFTWTPSADLNNIVKFIATVVRDGLTFWVGVQSAEVKVTV